MEVDLTVLQKPNLFEKFKTQVFKDFELSGASDYLPAMETNNLNQLKDEFYHSVLRLEMSNALKILLYRIDINELQIKKATQKDPEISIQHVIAELMIKRILQKVVLKDFYSK